MESLQVFIYLLIIASIAYSADIGLINATERISAPVNNSISKRLHAVNLSYNNSNETKNQDDSVETYTPTTPLIKENADVDSEDVLKDAKNPSPAHQTNVTKLYATALIGNRSVPLDFCLDKNSPMVLYDNKTINVSGNIVFPPTFTLGELPEPACIVMKLKDITYLDLSSDIVASKMIDVSERNINRTYSYSFNAPKPIKSHLNRTYILTVVLNIGWCHSKDSDEWIRKGDFLSIKRHVIEINNEGDSYQKDIQVECYACDRIHLNTLQYASSKLRTSIMEAKQPAEKTNVIPEMSDEIMNVAGEIVFPKPVYVIPPHSCVIVKLKDVSFQDSSSNVLASKVFPVSGENVRSIEYSLNSKKPTEENLSRVTVLTAVVNMGWCKSEESDDWLKEGDYLSVMRHRIVLSSDEDAYTMNINVVCYFCNEKKKRGLQGLPRPTGDPIKITRIPSDFVDKVVVPREEDSLPLRNFSDSNFSDRIVMNITGRITLPNELGVLPNESCLLIKMKDVSIMDGPSYVLASTTVDMTGTYVNQSIDYLLRSPKPPVEYTNRVYAISSVLNVGWCKNDTSSEWIRKGDFLSVKRHLIKFDFAKNLYETDIELICYACNDELEFITDDSVTSWISNQNTTLTPPIDIPTDNTLVVEMSNKTVNISGSINFPFPLHLIPTSSCITINLQDVTMMDVSANVLATTKIDISGMNITRPINYTIESSKPNVAHLHRGRIYTLQAVVNMGWCKESNSHKWIRGGDFMSAFSERVYLNEADNYYNADINVTCYSCGTKYVKPTLIPAADDVEEYEPTSEEEVTLLSVSPVKMSGDIITVDGEIDFPDEEIKFPDGSCLVIKLKDVSLADAFSDVLTTQVRHIGGREVFKSLEFTFKSQKPAVDFLNRVYALTAVINIGWCSDGSTSINGTKSTEWIRKGDYVSVERHTIIFEENRFEYGHNIKVICYECTKIKEPARIPFTTPTTQQKSKTKRPRKESSNVLPATYEKMMRSKGYKGDKGEDGNLGLLGNTGPPGLPGPAGYPGPDGEFGNLGPPGYKGRRGVRGIDGLSGFRNGPKGLRGERGPPGGYGPQGIRGFKGYKGQIGEHGPPGVPGQMGNHGEGGEHGKPGARGFPGKKGAEGKMGFQGPKGKFGPPGPLGKQGAQGLQGEAGDDGPTGIKGYLGAIGHMGFTGEDGNPGILGSKGPVGAPGLQGDPGYPGSPGKFGGRGINGEPGERGEPGIPGAKGSNGFDGGIGEIGKIGDPGLRGLRGLPGEIGPQGRRGPKGGKGAKGFIGMRGYKGIPGKAGEHGVPGVQGDKGESGTPGEKGPAGVKGTKGAGGDAGKEGIAGKRGVPGPAGEHGNDGLNGEKGLRGDPGETGPIGEKGNRGPVGKPGPIGIKGRKGGRGVIGGRGDIGAKGEEGYPGHPGEPGERGHYGQQGLKGPTGEDGEVGQTGPLGAKGDLGSAGKSGRPGPQGLRGHRGTTGLEGFEGLKGEPGRKGIKGPPGPTGPAGAPGEVGADGVVGETGKTGTPGTMGPDGKPGLQGRTGKVGKPGSIGPKGDAGIPGKRGHRGQTGERGSIGKKGIKGKHGFPGQKGRQGDQGKSGYSGERGAPGRRGEDGAVGPAGMIGPKGRKGGAGKKGYPGPAGARGPPGEEGPAGLRGQVGLPGTPGAYGKAGNPGPPGLPGKRGPQGIVGPNGARGETGQKGNEGTQGKRGKKGILGLGGDMGLPGQPGNQGTQGEPGEQGETGVPGVPGSTGTQGDLGDIGSPGRRGLRGQSGTPGLDGKRGDMGNMGNPGKDGDDGEKGKPGKPGIPGTIGVDGIPGDAGDKGEDGRKGSTGADGSVGKDGDIGDTGETGLRGRPGPKGRMGLRGRIGPEGKTGEQGSMGHSSRKVGNPGPIGEDGSTGPRGPIGDPGRKGIKGHLGRKGPDGLKGNPGSPGDNGESGSKGSTGRPGYPGSRGPKGRRGSRGEKGPAGYIGNDGNTGDEGFRGVKGQGGDIGPPGLKGPPGAPPIESLIPNARWRDYYTKNPTQFYQAVAGEYLTYISTEVDNIKYPPGTQSNPALNCREIYDNKKYTQNGLKWIDPTRGCAWDAFEVYCNFTAKGESCLVNTTSMNIKSLRDTNKGEILLSKYTKITYGISTPQLNFIRILSNYVWQEITLHCIGDVDHYKGIQLMGWNKKVFNAADKNRIEIKTNTCKTATKARPGKIVLRMYTEMDLTDIPIMDMAIKNRNIESVELGTTCFH